MFDNDKSFWDHMYSVDCSAPEETTTSPLNNGTSKVTSKENFEQPEVSPISNTVSNQVLVCGLCSLEFSSISEFQLHFLSLEHKNKISTASRQTPKATDLSRSYYCEICQVPLTSKDALEIHEAGKKHQKTLYRIQNVTAGALDGLTLENTSPSHRLDIVPQGGTQIHMSGSRLKEVDGAKHLDEKHDAIKSKQSFKSLPSDKAPCQSDVPRLTSKVLDVQILNSDNELNSLLRRLCLTQLISILMNTGSPCSCANAQNARSVTPAQIGPYEQSLLDLMRAICREELHSMIFQECFQSKLLDGSMEDKQRSAARNLPFSTDCPKNTSVGNSAGNSYCRSCGSVVK